MEHCRVSGWVAVFVLGAVAGASGCGSGSDTNDCKETRTCADDGGDQRGEGGEGGAGSEGGAPVDAPPGSAGGSPEAVPEAEGGSGSEGPVGAEGGGGSRPECEQDTECSNDDPNDGAEACVDGQCAPGNAPPRVTKITPENEAGRVEPGATITLELSEPIEPDSVTPENVQLLDGGVSVPARLSYEDGVIQLAPELPLRRRATYEVKLTKAVVDLEGAGLLNDFDAHFTVRDGEWHAIDAVRGDLLEVASALPLLPDGRALLAWAGKDGKDCPVAAAWVPLGASTATPTAFKPGTEGCYGVLAAAAGGSAAVAWSADNAWYLQQERGGAWQAAGARVITAPQPRLQTLALSPLGVLTRFEYSERGGVLSVRQTDAEGVWEAQGKILSNGHYASDPTVGFDAAGNGLAVWRTLNDVTSRARIVASRFVAAGGAWDVAGDLPGSVTAAGESYDLRGAPSVAVRPSGEAMAVWRAGPEGTSTLQASYFTSTGWELATLVSGTTKLPFIEAAPAITFDGERFVAAWLGTSAANLSAVFTATFEPETGWSAPVEHDAKKKLPTLEQPRLASDGHGSLLLVWRTGAAPNYTQVYRRFVGGAWGKIETLPGGTITDGRTTGVRGPSLSMNESGVAALSWANYDEEGRIATIRLETFH